MMRCGPAAACGRLGSALLLAAALLLLAVPCALRAHDTAGALRLHAFVQAEPAEGRLVLLLRVPLELLLNVDLPKRGNGYLDLERLDDALPRALAATTKGVLLLDGGTPLAVRRSEGRIALPSDRSFESFERALGALRGPRLPAATDVYWNQGYFDALIEYRLESAEPDLALDLRIAPGLRDRLRLDLRYLAPGGVVRAYEMSTGQGALALDPRWHQAALGFTLSGFGHILGGADHLLFLLVLMLPFRRAGWPLVGVVTAFTLAHSLTLSAAALGWVPAEPAFAPLVEWLIAVSIIVMALDNLFAPRLGMRWLAAALFGLVHGFGFSFALAQELQFAGSHLVLSLFAFNVGIELGQLLVLLLAWPLWAAALARWPAHERLAVAVVGAFVAHQAWHWASERLAAFERADGWALAARWWPQALAVLLVLAALALLAAALRRGGLSPRAGRRSA